MERLEAWLRDEQECPPVLYRPEATATATDADNFSRGYEKVRRELRRVGRLMLHLSKQLDALKRESADGHPG